MSANLPRPAQVATPREAVGFAHKRPGGFHGAKAVGSFVPGLTRKAFEKFGFSAATLVTDWPAIAGRELAAVTAPERLKWPIRPGREDVDGEEPADPKGRPGATLILRVDGAHALAVQYSARQIIERINAYFGYAAVAELRIVQAPVGEALRPAQNERRRRAEAQTVEVPGIADSGLREALARLGAGIRAAR